MNIPRGERLRDHGIRCKSIEVEIRGNDQTIKWNLYLNIENSRILQNLNFIAIQYKALNPLF